MSPREREKRDKKNSRGDESERQGRKKKMKESNKTEEIVLRLFQHLFKSYGEDGRMIFKRLCAIKHHTDMTAHVCLQMDSNL